MSYLLDTHIFLWWLEDNPRLDAKARQIIANPGDNILISAASVWEIGIKQAAGKLEAPESVVVLLEEEGFKELTMTARHAEAAAQLPPIHRDPFDRMLIAQARLEHSTLITHDEIMQAYDVRVLMA